MATNILYKDIHATYQKVVDQINSLDLLHYKLSFTTKNNDTITIRLGEGHIDTFCTVGYIINNPSALLKNKENGDEKNEENINKCHIYYVKSTLSNYTGEFLLYLQLLCGYMNGIHIFTLENFTNNQGRAAIGIYRQFYPNIKNSNLFKNIKIIKKIQNTGHNTRGKKENIQKKKELLNKLLYISEGEMILNKNKSVFKHSLSRDLIILENKITQKRLDDKKIVKENTTKKYIWEVWNIPELGDIGNFLISYKKFLDFIEKQFSKKINTKKRKINNNNNITINNKNNITINNKNNNKNNNNSSGSRNRSSNRSRNPKIPRFNPKQ